MDLFIYIMDIYKRNTMRQIKLLSFGCLTIKLEVPVGLSVAKTAFVIAELKA